MKLDSIKTNENANTKPKVSVVCISYNQEKYIEQTLDGFLMQKTNFPVEIIIADDASTDKTASIIRKYEKQNPGCFQANLRIQNIGAIDNLLDTLKAASGDYIALCEGDDFWTNPTKLQKQVDFLDTHPDFSLVFHPVRVFFENQEEEEKIFPDFTEGEQFTIKKLLEDNFIQTNSVMYRRINYDNLSSDVMPFDWYLHLIHAKNGKIGFLNEVMSTYRRHDGGLWWEMYKNPQAAWKKHGKSYLSLCRELMNYYGDNLEYNEIIRKHIARVYEAFNRGATKEGDGVYESLAVDSIAHVPSVTWIYLKSLLAEKEQLIALHNDNQKSFERGLHDRNIKLQEMTEHMCVLNDELTAIKSSRMWRYTVKYRGVKRRIKRLLGT